MIVKHIINKKTARRSDRLLFFQDSCLRRNDTYLLMMFVGGLFGDLAGIH